MPFQIDTPIETNRQVERIDKHSRTPIALLYPIPNLYLHMQQTVEHHGQFPLPLPPMQTVSGRDQKVANHSISGRRGIISSLASASVEYIHICSKKANDTSNTMARQESGGGETACVRGERSRLRRIVAQTGRISRKCGPILARTRPRFGATTAETQERFPLWEYRRRADRWRRPLRCRRIQSKTSRPPIAHAPMAHARACACLILSVRNVFRAERERANRCRCRAGSGNAGFVRRGGCRNAGFGAPPEVVTGRRTRSDPARRVCGVAFLRFNRTV